MGQSDRPGDRLAAAIRRFLDWHGYDNAEGLADALAEYEEATAVDADENRTPSGGRSGD